MKERIEPGLINDLKTYGVDVGNWNDCFHCGNCTALCPLTEKGVLFPRKQIRLLQIGLEKDLTSSIEPWMCYYCGDCSKSCPRDANPGELMMSLRRWLTTVYDWTGISKLIYKSKALEIAAIIGIAIVVGILYIRFTANPFINTQQYVVDGKVMINDLAPAWKIHIGDWIMAGMLAFLLITNLFNMWYKVILRNKELKVPFFLYFTSAFSLAWHFMTQSRFKKCDSDSRFYWFIHLFLMLSYVMLFTMIVFFLEWFQTNEVHDWWHPQRLLGYIATIGLFTGIIYFTIKRRKKSREGSKYSHYTDWTFLVLLFLTTITGILLHFFRVTGMPVATWFTYLIHLMVLVPMLTIEVPFSKWSHLAYRPFAVYFANVIKAAKKRRSKV
ncbi:MAG: 4Fe-4S dicluster domain-containing protein [Bacteroidales bacterium]|nr:4Fe-4S dicluster domain-containing protein [Bacteroidales bacterium]